MILYNRYNIVFGGWNLFSFVIGSCIGYSSLFFLKVFSKRTINAVRLLKSGDYVEIDFFNAFWVLY